MDLLSYGIRRRRRCFQRANCQMCLEEAKKTKNWILLETSCILDSNLECSGGCTKRGTFKQMAAVAMDKNGNP